MKFLSFLNKLTSNKQKLSANKQKLTNNEKKITSRAKSSVSLSTKVNRHFMMRLNDVTNKQSDHLEKPNLATNSTVFSGICSLLILITTYYA